MPDIRSGTMRRSSNDRIRSHGWTMRNGAPRSLDVHDIKRGDGLESPNLNVFAGYRLVKCTLLARVQPMASQRVTRCSRPQKRYGFVCARAVRNVRIARGFFTDKTDRLTTTARSIRKTGFRGLNMQSCANRGGYRLVQVVD